MFTRRHLLAGTVACGAFARAARAKDALARRFAEIERDSGGRLGVAVRDTQTGRRDGHRGGERFPICSTFKLLADAAVLARVDSGHENLDRVVHYDASALLDYAPVTKQHVSDGLTVAAICAAAVTLSDNTAGNLMLESLGGPAGLTGFLRAQGDDVSRLDRTEPTLNEARPGDLRDTTTPDAMIANLKNFVLGDALRAPSREQLIAWMRANKTSGKRLGAALPAGWALGDKTGTGDRGSTNDVGVIWPSGRKPILVAVYLTETSAAKPRLEATIADVGRAVVTAAS